MSTVSTRPCLTAQWSAVCNTRKQTHKLSITTLLSITHVMYSGCTSLQRYRTLTWAALLPSFTPVTLTEHGLLHMIGWGVDFFKKNILSLWTQPHVSFKPSGCYFFIELKPKKEDFCEEQISSCYLLKLFSVSNLLRRHMNCAVNLGDMEFSGITASILVWIFVTLHTIYCFIRYYLNFFYL